VNDLCKSPVSEEASVSNPKCNKVRIGPATRSAVATCNILQYSAIVILLPPLMSGTATTCSRMSIYYTKSSMSPLYPRYPEGAPHLADCLGPRSGMSPLYPGHSGVSQVSPIWLTALTPGPAQLCSQAPPSFSPLAVRKSRVSLGILSHVSMT